MKRGGARRCCCERCKREREERGVQRSAEEVEVAESAQNEAGSQCAVQRDKGPAKESSRTFGESARARGARRERRGEFHMATHVYLQCVQRICTEETHVQFILLLRFGDLHVHYHYRMDAHWRREHGARGSTVSFAHLVTVVHSRLHYAESRAREGGQAPSPPGCCTQSQCKLSCPITPNWP